MPILLADPAMTLHICKVASERHIIPLVSIPHHLSSPLSPQLAQTHLLLPHALNVLHLNLCNLINMLDAYSPRNPICS